MSVAECDFCGGTDTRPLNAYGPRCLRGDYRITTGRAENVWCVACGLAWNSVMMNEAELAAFYAGYTKKVGSEEEDDLLFGGPEQEVETLTDSQARFVAMHVSAPTGRVLDIGCGKGAFLKAFAARRPGWHCAGVEPSREEAAIARHTPAFEIHEGMFGEATLERESFDLVTIMHVLEHVRRPSIVVGQMRELIRPGGLLFVEVPNVLDPNMFYDLLLFEHLYHFSPETLVWFLEREGFDIVAVEPSTSYGAQRIVARKRRKAAAAPVRLPLIRMAEGFQEWTALWARMNRIADAGVAQARAGRRVAIFGAGMTSATWLAYTALHDAAVVGCLDESPWKIGRPFFGRPVHALADAATLALDAVLIATMPNSQRRVLAKLAPLAAQHVEIIGYEGEPAGGA
jgi:SAM-dependent methyltransferase